MLNRSFKYFTGILGLDIRRKRDNTALQNKPVDVFEKYPDLSTSHKQILSRVAPFTMTSVDRLEALLNAVAYIVHANIPGTLVECGVWKGGSAMAMILKLQELGMNNRTLFLYDTFEAGMTKPHEEYDVSYTGIRASDALAAWEKNNTYPSMEEVWGVLKKTGYPEESVRLIKGDIQETIPRHDPGTIALLRLDTDWYESTKYELEALYDKVPPGGVIIIDDYGHWKGARKAVDEFFSARSETVYLHRVDYTCRLMVKNAR